MTAEVFLDATETGPSVDAARHGAGGLLVQLPQVAEPTRSRPAAARQVQAQAPWVLALGAGVVTAVLVHLDALVVATTLLLWLAVHLHARRGGLESRVGPARPAARDLVRHVSVPFAAVGLAVVAGALDARALGNSLVLAGVATAAFVVLSPLARTARTPLRVVAVGDREGVGHVASSWSQCRDVDLVAAVVDDRDGDPDLDLETFGLPQARGLASAADLAVRHGADTVVVLPGTPVDRDDLRRLCWSLEDTRTSLAVLSAYDKLPLRRLSLAHVAGHTVTEIAPSRPAAHVRLGKALVDRVGGTLLLLLASPLLLALVVAIRLDTPGPAFFRQVRVGQDGRLFTMFKLRTMVTDAEARKAELVAEDEGNGVLFKIRRDPRITRVGRFLRRSSLDELPQLINVVRGEMSLVGPRPALPREVEQYDALARRRLAVKPGMTGLWQVSGRSDLDWDTSVELDVHYTDNVAILDDLRICLQTVRAVTGGRGAY